VKKLYIVDKDDLKIVTGGDDYNASHNNELFDTEAEAKEYLSEEKILSSDRDHADKIKQELDDNGGTLLTGIDPDLVHKKKKAQAEMAIYNLFIKYESKRITRDEYLKKRMEIKNLAP